MNDQRAHELWAWLEKHDDRWYQWHWTNIPAEYFNNWELFEDENPKHIVKEGEGHTINCGTTACVAGHASFMWAPEGTKFFRENLITPDNTVYWYSAYARKVLDLTTREADYLFEEYRSLEEIGDFLTGDNSQREAILDDYDKDL